MFSPTRIDMILNTFIPFLSSQFFFSYLSFCLIGIITSKASNSASCRHPLFSPFCFVFFGGFLTPLVLNCVCEISFTELPSKDWLKVADSVVYIYSTRIHKIY